MSSGNGEKKNNWTKQSVLDFGVSVQQSLTQKLIDLQVFFQSNSTEESYDCGCFAWKSWWKQTTAGTSSCDACLRNFVWKWKTPPKGTWSDAASHQKTPWNVWNMNFVDGFFIISWIWNEIQMMNVACFFPHEDIFQMKTMKNIFSIASFPKDFLRHASPCDFGAEIWQGT